MLAKIIPSKDGVGVGGDGFAGCIGYVVGKSTHVETRNIGSLATAAREMRAVANSKPLTKPVIHIVLTWPEGEKPSHKQGCAAADQMISALDLQNHHAVIAIHEDTENFHVHIVINKRSLDGRSADLHNEYKRLQKAAREIEIAQGWSADRGGWETTIEDGEVRIGKRVHHDRDKTRPTDAEIMRERKTGQQPLRIALLEDSIHEKLAAAFEESKNWTELHARLAEMGLQYLVMGSGAKLCTITDSNNACSPSHLCKDWSRGRLEQRFGPIDGQAEAALATSVRPPISRPTQSIDQAVESDDEGKNDGHGPSSSTPLMGTEDFFWALVTARIKFAFLQYALAQKYRALQEKNANAALQRRAARRAEKEALEAEQKKRSSDLDTVFGAGTPAREVMGKWEKRQAGRENRELRQAQKKNPKVPKPRNWRGFLRTEAAAGNADAKTIHQTTKLSASRDAMRAIGIGNAADELSAMRRIDLVKLATGMGYIVDEIESTKASIKMRNGADVVIVRPESDGTYSYFDTGDDADNGGVIQFVQSRQGGSLGDVRKFLRPFLDKSVVTNMQISDIARYQDHTAARQGWEAGVTKVPPYLLARGISSETIGTYAADQVREDRFGNVLFAHRDQRGNLMGYEVKGAAWSGFGKGGQRALATFGQDGALKDAARIVIVESGIDALSLAQLEDRNDALYCSTGGGPGRRTVEEIRQLVARHPNAEIFLGFDADEAGDRHAKRVAEELGHPSSRLRPAGGLKDWNDLLRAQTANAPAPQASPIADRTDEAKAAVAAENQARVAARVALMASVLSPIARPQMARPVEAAKPAPPVPEIPMPALPADHPKVEEAIEEYGNVPPAEVMPPTIAPTQLAAPDASTAMVDSAKLDRSVDPKAIEYARAVTKVQPARVEFGTDKRGMVYFEWPPEVSELERDRRVAIMKAPENYDAAKAVLIKRFAEMDPEKFAVWEKGGRAPIPSPVSTRQQSRGGIGD